MLYYKVDSIEFYLVKSENIINEKFMFLKEPSENDTISGVLLKFNISPVKGNNEKGENFTASYSGMFGCIDSLENILVQMNNSNKSEFNWSSFENIEGVYKEGDKQINGHYLVPDFKEYYNEEKPVGTVFQASSKLDFINSFNVASADNPNRNGQFGNSTSFNNYYLLKLDNKVVFNKNNRVSVKFIFSNNYVVNGINKTNLKD